MRGNRSTALVCVLAFGFGCSGAGGGSNSDGTAGNAGASTGGASTTGGSSTGGSATGGSTATGGSGTTGGSPATGGSTTGGSATGGSSTGGSATGGSATGGTGGTHVVGSCSSLGAVDKFEDITPPGADLSGNGITNILADPIHTGTIFAGSDHKGLFKSTNCGADWVKINTGRNADILDGGTLWSMALDYADPDVIYLGSLYSSDSSLFKTTDGGVNWDSLFPKGSEVYNTVDYNFFQDLSIDPTDHKHLVVTFHANCKGPFGPQCMAETKDSGTTWRIFKGPLSGWGEGSGPFVLGATTWLLATTQGGFYYTSDSGATWEKVASGSDHSMYRTQAGVYYTGSDYGVNRSTDGHKWTTIQNSPNGYGMAGDGKRLFNSLRNAGNQQPYFWSAETDGTTWKPFPSPNMLHGAVYFAFDSDHHVLYSANTSSGLWRMVTQ